MTSIRIISWAAVGLLASSISSSATPQGFDLAVKRAHLLGASHGTLVIGEAGVEYRTPDKKDARRWTYEQIKELQIVSPTRIVVRTYEDQGWSHLWTDRSFTFAIQKGTATPELAAFLIARMPRAVVTSVSPPIEDAPRYTVAVKHVRSRQGSQGELLLYDHALEYRSPQAGASRFWRFGDIASVYRVDPYRLELVTYDGGGGDTRTFAFQLKTDLPPGFYDTLWAFVNAPASLVRPPGR